MVTSFYHGEKNHYGFFTQVSNLILQSTIESPFDIIDTNVNVLTQPELEQSWYDIVGELSKAELEQIKYWKPNTVGDIIFNFWD